VSKPNSKTMILGSANVQAYKSCVDVSNRLFSAWDKDFVQVLVCLKPPKDLIFYPDTQKCSFFILNLYGVSYTQVELFTCQLDTDFVRIIDTFG